MSNKYVVYTCITGGYDKLHEIKFRSKNVDYICFTDNANLKSNTWQIRQLPESIVSQNDALTNVKKQRLIKILPHRFLQDYDVSLWIDSNIEMIVDVIDFFKKYQLTDAFFYTNRHPSRNCIYKENLACLRQHRDTYENMQPQIDRYISEGYPSNNGLAETNIILRKHNDFRCKKLMSMWAEEILMGSHRDQLSYNYCVWKLGYENFVKYFNEARFDVKSHSNAFFKISNHVRIDDFIAFSRNATNFDNANENVINDNSAIVKNENSDIENVSKTKTNNRVVSTIKKKIETITKVVSNVGKIDFNEKILNKISNFVHEEKEAPLVSVVMFTHNRTKVAKFCLKNLIENLKYPNLRWIISDDRSDEGHVEQLLDEFSKSEISNVVVCRTTDEHYGLGASMNNGLREAFKNTDVVLRVEDDWALEKELDLKPHVDFLLKHSDVAGIRMGMVGGGVNEVPGKKFNGYKTICGNDVKTWLFVNQVFLVHKRIHNVLGWYIDGKDADKTEVDFREKYNRYSRNGKARQYVLVPREMKWRTYDDSSLWFIHIGKSTLGHGIYQPPIRYQWLYDPKELITQEAVEANVNFGNNLEKKLISKLK